MEIEVNELSGEVRQIKRPGAGVLDDEFRPSTRPRIPSPDPAEAEPGRPGLAPAMHPMCPGTLEGAIVLP